MCVVFAHLYYLDYNIKKSAIIVSIVETRSRSVSSNESCHCYCCGVVDEWGSGSDAVVNAGSS